MEKKLCAGVEEVTQGLIAGQDVAKNLDFAISSVDLGTIAAESGGMKMGVTEKWELQTIMYAYPNRQVRTY